MPDYLHEIIININNWPLIIRLLTILVAAAIEYVFPIFPGDTIVLAAGFLSAQGGLGLIETAIASLLGTLLGAYAAYAIGRAIARGHIGSAWLRRFASEENLKQWKVWFNKWGYFLILINRFFPGIRAFFFVAAGLYNLPLSYVLLYGALSALIFNCFLFGLGYLLGNNVENIIEFLDTYTIIVYIMLFLIFAGVIFMYFRRKKTNK